eukprot:6214770-Pleurochrysis_carterae.AAC.8
METGSNGTPEDGANAALQTVKPIVTISNTASSSGNEHDPTQHDAVSDMETDSNGTPEDGANAALDMETDNSSSDVLLPNGAGATTASFSHALRASRKRKNTEKVDEENPTKRYLLLQVAVVCKSLHCLHWRYAHLFHKCTHSGISKQRTCHILARVLRGAHTSYVPGKEKYLLRQKFTLEGLSTFRCDE